MYFLLTQNVLVSSSTQSNSSSSIGSTVLFTESISVTSESEFTIFNGIPGNPAPVPISIIFSLV